MAALVPVVLILRMGCPVTRLFQEYGSAIRRPGVVGFRSSSLISEEENVKTNEETKIDRQVD